MVGITLSKVILFPALGQFGDVNTYCQWLIPRNKYVCGHGICFGGEKNVLQKNATRKNRTAVDKSEGLDAKVYLLLLEI